MEPRFDFDLSTQQLSASDGAAFILNGAKCLVPLADGAGIADLCAPEASKGYAGVEGFIVPRNWPASRFPPEKNMGLKGLKTYEVTLEDCRVNADARLGGDKGINFSRLMGDRGSPWQRWP